MWEGVMASARTSSLLRVVGVYTRRVQDGDAHLPVRVHCKGGVGRVGGDRGQIQERKCHGLCSQQSVGLLVPLGCHILLMNFITGGACG
jgi:hypothetical protein